MDHSQYIVERLEESRGERGISVAELARRADIPRKRLYCILDGERQLRADEFLRLSIVLDLPMRLFIPQAMLVKYEAMGRRTVEDYGTGTTSTSYYTHQRRTSNC